MESKDLRIGNLIEVDNQIVKIGQINEKDFSFKLKSRVWNPYLPYTDSRIKPIPLTEEWILKFGYELITDNHYSVLGHLIWKCNDLFMCDKNGIVLKYVHQLQNLYFALNNEELKLK